MKTRKTMAGRRGFSIVEAAVALAVIVLVSAATMTLILRASEVEKKVAIAMERNEQVENAIECYRWANGRVDDFTAALMKAGYDDTLRFTLTESDYIEVTLETDGDGESRKLTGIVIRIYVSGECEVIHYA